MTHLAEVVTLYESNASQIAEMLRTAAASIDEETDADDRTRSIVAVQVCESGRVKVYGWGETDSHRSIGALHIGAAQICDIMNGRDE